MGSGTMEGVDGKYASTRTLSPSQHWAKRLYAKMD